jgi:hypothetical protein
LLFLLQKRGKAVEPLGPELLVAIEPFKRVAHRLGVEPAGDGASGFRACQEPRIGQHVEMLHHRGQRHRERRGELADRQIGRGRKPHHQRAPSRVRQCGESAVEGGIQKLNHVV